MTEDLVTPADPGLDQEGAGQPARLGPSEDAPVHGHGAVAVVGGSTPRRPAARPSGRGRSRGRAGDARRSPATLGAPPHRMEPGADAPVGGEAADPAEDRGGWSPPRRGRGARRPGTVPTRIAVVLALVALVALVAAVTFGLKWSALRAQAAQSATVQKVATTFLNDLTNFKPTTVDADFGALLSFASGDFAKQANQFFGSDIRQKLEQAQAQSEGQVRNLYVQSLRGDNAQVYAVVDQTYVNSSISKSGGQPVPDVLRVVLSLSDVSGNWKISEVSVLQAPSSSSGTGTAVPAGR